MLAELDVHGVVLGHSERRQLFGETDKALQLKVPAALDAGPEADPVRRRDRGGARERRHRAQLRHQVQEGLEKVASERLGDVVIAYEPIWAIGTGKVATPEQAQEAIAFVRALVADRSKEQAERTRILYGGSREAPTTRPSCSRCPTSTARWSAARRWTPAQFAAIVDAAPTG